ncbi:MAG: peptidoglycan DD-metalloendopeptidase family protein [Eubacterium sp.]|nr:peptidoglycan DD-metalloendopeptidase family protein [Eubacterium sp.]
MKELFTGILNISISAGILIIVCVLVRLIFRKMPKFVRCLMWLLVAVRLAIPFAIESPLSLLPAREYVTVSSNNEAADKVADKAEHINNVDSADTSAKNDADKSNVAEVDTVESINSVAAKNNAENISENIVENTAENTAESINTPGSMSFLGGIDVMYILSIVWIVGVAAFLIYALVSFIRLRRLVDDAVLLRDNIYQSERVGTAFILGVIRPRIYVPYGLGLNELYMSISHEKAHISRRDHLVKPLGFIIAAVYWFNPLVWLAYILLCRDIELACDEKVIKKIGYDKKKDYSQALLNLSIPRKYISACPVAFGEVGINERIKNVLTMKKGKKIIIAVAVAICAVLAICFLTYPKKPKNNSGDTAKTQTTEETKETITEDLAANENESSTEVKEAESNEENASSEDEETSTVGDVADSDIYGTETTGTKKVVYILKGDGGTVNLGDKIIIDGEEVQLVSAASNEDFASLVASHSTTIDEETGEEQALEIYVTDISAAEAAAKAEEEAAEAAGGVASITKDDQGNEVVEYSYKDPSSDKTEVHIVKLNLQDTVDLPNSTSNEDLNIYFPVIGSGTITRQFSEEHQGVDIAAEEGTVVVSLYAGTVEEVGKDDKDGNYIIIKNEKGCTVKYSHLKDAPNVSKGNKVDLGEEIGKVGSTGESTGPHVHIEVTDEKGTLIDPMSIIEYQ